VKGIFHPFHYRQLEFLFLDLARLRSTRAAGLALPDPEREAKWNHDQSKRIVFQSVVLP